LITKNTISSLLIAWGMISILIIAVLIVPFLIKSDLILQNMPICPSKLNQSNCFLCGMTQAFIEISHGNLDIAQEINQLSIPLYSIFTINSIIFAFLLIKKVIYNGSKTS
tara:strand:+ start:514 stop:843 length:330 start_codon:yes stop_codon:yes gene_type:complete